MRAHYSINYGPEFRVLSLDQITEIHSASIEILESIGILINEKNARELLINAGARIDKNRVRIPPSMVEDALRTAPSKVSVFDRNGELSMALDRNNIYFGGQSDLLNYLDPVTHMRRRLISDDIAVMTRLVDALPNIDFTICGSEASDYPAEVSAKVGFLQAVQNTSKPLGFVSKDDSDLAEILDIAEIIVGGRNRLAERPFIIHYAEPVSPLMNYEPAVRKLLFCAERRIPVIYAPMLQLGATAPAKLAGVLAQGCAESLGGLILHQLAKKGAPFIFGSIPMMFDMRTMILPYGSPELHLLSSAMADMAHYYGLPVFGTAGCTDAKAIDAQAGVETALSVCLAALAGSNLIHDVGLMDHATILTPDFLVFADEVISCVKNYFRPIEVNDEALSIDVIARVGPGGHFLKDKHTREHFKECWYPTLFDRMSYEQWTKNGNESLSERIRKKTTSILEKHKGIPIPEDTVKELEKFKKKLHPL